jgi:allantoate deiminase
VFEAEARRVIDWCRVLAAHSESPANITRVCLSDPMRLVHRDLSAWMTRLGMTTSIDAAGNLRGIRPAIPLSLGPLVPPSLGPLVPSSPGPSRFFMGSHLDTVPDAGAFDGVLGVIWALAVIESLRDTPLPFDVEVIGFSDEEGVRFRTPFIGSRALAGTLDDDLLSCCDAAGVSLRDALVRFGADPSQRDRAIAPASAIGYLECHIEQGPVLEHLERPLAVVDRIAGQTRAEVTFVGAARHAGTTPMSLRADAVAAAAEWIVVVEAEATRADGAVATCGRVEASPGAVNVIAGSCCVSLDVRHASDDTRAALVGTLRARAQAIADRRGVHVEWTTRMDQPAVAMDASLSAALVHAVERCGHIAAPMTSGAGHDAMIVAARMPAAMLFVRSPGGVSHHPDERVIEGDVAAAIAVGREFLLGLAQRLA